MCVTIVLTRFGSGKPKCRTIDSNRISAKPVTTLVTLSIQAPMPQRASVLPVTEVQLPRYQGPRSYYNRAGQPPGG